MLSERLNRPKPRASKAKPGKSGTTVGVNIDWPLQSTGCPEAVEGVFWFS
jgi:hypothetical protein